VNVAGRSCVRKVERVEEKAGVRSFKLQDLNKHWWEITSVAQSYYDEVFARALIRADAHYWNSGTHG